MHQPAPPPCVPPLENGDRLPRAEFERRYEAMPFCVKAELVEGVVYRPSPARDEQHGEPQSKFVAALRAKMKS